MAYYEVDVIEVRHVRMRYIVEAENTAEAMDLARNGETVEEVDHDYFTVNDRDVSDTPMLKPNYVPPGGAV